MRILWCDGGIWGFFHSLLLISSFYTYSVFFHGLQKYLGEFWTLDIGHGLDWMGFGRFPSGLSWTTGNKTGLGYFCMGKLVSALAFFQQIGAAACC